MWVPSTDSPSLRLARARRRLAMPENGGVEMLCRHAVRCGSTITAILCAALPLGAFAQQATPSNHRTEIPARLRHLEGTVTVQRAAAGETEQAVMNLPLGSGDRIWSSESGRVEIMFEDGTSLWMYAETTLDFVSLPRPEGLNGAIVRLWTGSVFVQRPAPQSGTLLPLRMDSPAGTVTFDQAGLFRVDLDEDGRVWLSAYDGSASLDAGGLSERVYAGQRTLAELESAPARAVAFNTSEADAFSNWRDERMALLASTQQYVRQRDYVPGNISSYAADLEPYGDWSYHSTYAAWYWKPYAAVAWSPYRHGRWVYTYAGWSWVPEASWGYVTTHYGRWQHGSGGWMWFPGRVWAPASVRWYVGGGYVGWAPLNYWGRPAVSFGVHIGGGLSVSVGVSFGGYYNYPYYSYYYPYYGYGYSSWGYRSCYRCGGKVGRGGWGYNRVVHDSSRRRETDRIGPLGSASGTGRVVAGRGYSSGLADAWTVVPADQFSTAEVGRVAVARSALPKDLNQASKALLSGNLRTRQPSTLVPDAARRARPTTVSPSRLALGSSDANTAVRSTSRGAQTALDASAPRRTARARSATAAGNPAAVTEATRRTAGASSNARRAVPTTGRAPRASAPSAGRSTTSGRAATPAPTADSRSALSPSTRRALRRDPRVAPRSTVPAASAAARVALGRSSYPSSGAARRALTSPRTTSPPTQRGSGTVRSSPRRSASPRARDLTPARSAPSPRSSGSLRTAPTVRRAPTARPSGGIRPASRPPSSGGAVRPPARSSGAGARPPARAAKPRRPGGGASE